MNRPVDQTKSSSSLSELPGCRVCREHEHYLQGENYLDHTLIDSDDSVSAVDVDVDEVGNRGREGVPAR
jgi:hypothetical protein